MHTVGRLLELPIVVRVLVLPQPIPHPDLYIVRLRYRLLGTARMLGHVREIALRGVVLVR